MKKPQQHLIIVQLLTLTALPIILQQIRCSQLIETGSSQQELRSPKIEAHSQELLVAKKLASDNHSPLAAAAAAVGRQVSQNRTTSVGDLRLAPDFRAARLRWTYRREGELLQRRQVEPASFDVRFCELTTWHAEIKCRHREMFANTTATTPTDNSVIQTTKPAVDGQKLTVLRNSNDLIEYEAQIFDLRALTNYTFHVRVLRFSDEPAQIQLDSQLDNQQHKRTSKAASDRSSLARRLSVDEQATNEILGRVETKPFRAEATKCLADVSEVVITTGKYFGGRITVEGSPDKRCQLIGNKSSEQTSYSFRIDHEICHSKVIDGNRIETMVLVHENKDILTHNTARFLVLCNFLQKSFTLRASISLPKVNGIMSNRPAVITPLHGRPSKEKAVQLGSMPGVFRAKPTDPSTETSSLSNELDTQSSEERNPLAKVMDTDSRQRQPKLLDQRQRPRFKSMDLMQAGASATSPALGQTTVPEPVQIQSKLLYVDRQPIANLVATKIIPTATVENESVKSVSSHGNNQTQQQPRDDLEGRRSPVKLEEASSAVDDSIILTNNHRVVGDFRPISSLRLAPDSQSSSSSLADARDDGDLSIKYSGAARISDYSIGQVELPTVRQTNHSESLVSRHRGERTGRMHKADSSAAAGDQIGGRDFSLQSSAAGTNRRMGDMMLETTGADLLAETSNNDSEIIQSPHNQSTSVGSDNVPPPIVQQNSSPVQNLTNYLLKWSLKTLTNLAKKSLESLANRSDSSLHHSESPPAAAAAAAASDDDDDDEEEPVSRSTLERQQQPMVVAPRTIVTTARPSAAGSQTTTTTTKPEISTSDGFDTHSRPQLQQRVQTRLANTATSRSQSTSISTSTSTSAPPSSAPTVSVSGAHPAIKQATHPQQHQRASNYSKSLDLDKSEATRAKQLQQQRQVKATPAVQEQARDYLARSNESGGQHLRHDRDAIPDYHGSMSWLLVGCLLVLALVMSILTIFCLASSHQSPFFASSQSHPTPTHQQMASALPKTVSTLPRLVFSRTIAGNHGQSNETLNSQADMLPSYSERYDYNQFQNHTRAASASSSSSSQLGRGGVGGGGGGYHGADSSAASSSSGSSSIDGDSTNRLALLGNRQTTQSAQLSGQLPPASLSSCNRAGNTSHLSSALGDEDDENNCTNSELLLTEHVLLSSANSRNESYA